MTALEMVERLASQHRWSDRTIKTLLSRLLRKGDISYTAEANRYLYEPEISHASWIHHASRSFLQRVFGSDAGLMLAHPVETKRLTRLEIKSLKRILNQKTDEHA